MNRIFSTGLLLAVALTFGAGLLCSTCQAQDAKKSKRNIRKGYESYVDGLFKNYDIDRDGRLNLDEVRNMRRKPSRKADANGDRKISRDELLDSYLQKAGILRIAKINDPNQSDEKEKDGEEKKDGQEESEKPKAKAPEPLAVGVYILRSEAGSDFEDLASKFDGKSQEAVNELVQEIRGNKEFECDVDAFQFTVAWNNRFKLNAVSQVPVVTDTNTHSDGSTTTNSETREVGTVLSLTASNEYGGQYLNVDLTKSSVFDSDAVLHESEAGDKTYAKQIATVTLESGFPFEKNEANVISMSDSGSSWLLIFVTK